MNISCLFFFVCLHFLNNSQIMKIKARSLFTKRFSLHFHFFVFITSIYLFFLSFPLSANELEKNDSIVSTGKNVVIYVGDHEFPPFEFIDKSGQASGFHIDLLSHIAEIKGWEIEFRLSSFDKALQSFKNKESDIIALYRSAHRETYAAFANPHTIIFHDIFRRSDSPEISSLDDISGKTVIVQQDAYVHDFIRDRFPDAKIVTASSEQHALLLLSTGVYDCAIVSRASGNLTIKELKLKNIVSSSPAILPVEYCFAVNINDSSLLSALNNGIKQSRITGTYNDIQQKWMQSYWEISGSIINDLKKVIWLLAILFIAFLLVFAWAWSLKMLVNRRSKEIHQELSIRYKVEQDLASQEKKLASILRAAPVGIGVVSNRIIMDLNDVMTTITGYERSELLGKNARILYPSDEEYHKVGDEKYKMIEESGIGTIETKWKRKNGEEIVVLLSSSPIEASDPIKGVTFVAVNISAKNGNPEIPKN